MRLYRILRQSTTTYLLYFMFYLVKGVENSVLPPVVLVQSQIDEFNLSNENDVLDVTFNCEQYGFDILVTMTQIS